MRTFWLKKSLLWLRSWLCSRLLTWHILHSNPSTTKPNPLPYHTRKVLFPPPSVLILGHLVLSHQLLFLCTLPRPSTYNCVEVMLFFKQVSEMSLTNGSSPPVPAAEDFLHLMPPTHSWTHHHLASTITTLWHSSCQGHFGSWWLIHLQAVLILSPKNTWFSGPSLPLAL